MDIVASLVVCVGIVLSFNPGDINSSLMGCCLVGVGEVAEMALFCVLHAKLASLRSQELQKKFVKEEKVKLLRQQENFVAQALMRVEGRKVVSFVLPSTEGSEFLRNVLEARDDFGRIRDIQRFGGAMHRCVTTNKIPGVLFKSNSSLYHREAEYYVARADACRKSCDENFLYIPQCKEFMVDSQGQLVMEEWCDLTASDHVTSYAFYQWILHEPRLEEYTRTLFERLAVFICQNSFADVKYDNIILKKDGRICLFDLWDPPTLGNNKIIGLTSGQGQIKEGLFSMLPSKWIDDFVNLVQPYLTPQEQSELHEQLPRIRLSVGKREEMTRLVAAFYKKRNIDFPRQPLVWREQDFSSLGRGQRAILKEIVCSLNGAIKKHHAISLIGGRCLWLDSELPHSSSLYRKFKAGFMDSRAELYLKLLQDKGYIFSYEPRNCHQTLIVC